MKTMTRSFFDIQNILFSVIFLAVLTIGISSNIYPSAWATLCTDCLTNNSIQTLTIFVHQNDEYPFLTGNATVLIYPNPLAYTVNATDVDASVWGRGLMVIDDGPLDSDLTPGVIELVGVNNGTYSVFQLKNPPSVLPNDEPVSADIDGTPGSVGIVNYFLNTTSAAESTSLPPVISETTVSSLATSGAKINGVTISSSEDLPSAKIIAKTTDILTIPSPTPIIFTTVLNSPVVTASSLYASLQIPTYSAPSTSGADVAYLPPMFKATDDGGNNLIMTPVLDKISAGTDLHLKLDNLGIGSGHPPIDSISLPLATDGINVGVRVQINDNIPPAFPSSPVSGTVLFLDVDTVGDLDLGNPSTFSADPKIMFNVAPDSNGNCSVLPTVYLYTSNHWHPTDDVPQRNPSADVPGHACAYIQTVKHFSSYLISGASSVSHDHSGHSHGTMGMDDMHSDNDMLSMIVKQLDIQQIGYNVCGLDLVRIVVATTDDAKSVHVTVRGDKTGLVDAQLSTNQIYDEHNQFFPDKKYVFEALLASGENLIKVTVSDNTYALHKTVQTINGDRCFGTIDHISTNSADAALGVQLYDGYEILDHSAHMSDDAMAGMENAQNMTSGHDQMGISNDALMHMNNHDVNMTSMSDHGNMMSNSDDSMKMESQQAVVPEFGSMSIIMLVISVLSLLVISKMKNFVALQ